LQVCNTYGLGDIRIIVSPWFGLAAVGCRKLIGFHAWQNASNSWGSEECLVLAKQFESIDLFYFVLASVTMLSQKLQTPTTKTKQANELVSDGTGDELDNYEYE